jgi:3-oxoadipate enol-lactonase
MQQSFVASDGIRIAYMIDDFTDPWRQAPTLLLLHAAMGSSKRWYAAVPPLCRDYRVVRMDLRGHGESQVPPPEPPLSMDRLVQDVRELLDLLGCSTAHVVGNSAGGYVAQNLAMQSPERARSLLLFGSTPGLKNSQAHTWLPRVARRGSETSWPRPSKTGFRPATTPATSNGSSMRPRRTTPPISAASLG